MLSKVDSALRFATHYFYQAPSFGQSWFDFGRKIQTRALSSSALVGWIKIGIKREVYSMFTALFQSRNRLTRANHALSTVWDRTLNQGHTHGHGAKKGEFRDAARQATVPRNLKMFSVSGRDKMYDCSEYVQ